jgi:hypothetical protein
MSSCVITVEKADMMITGVIVMIYCVVIIGLAPNTVYRVTVRAKNIRAPNFDEKASQQMERFSCHVDFRTLPKGGTGINPIMLLS